MPITKEEGDAVDFITHCMYSLGYLNDISELTFSDKKDQITVGQFYKQWTQKTGAKEFIPFNLGIFLAYLYVGILFAKEKWVNLLPNDRTESSQEDWGLREARVSAPRKRNPTVRYTVRRIRNSLGHGYPAVIIPEATSRKERFAKVIFSFHDENPGNNGDTFDATLTLDQLIKLVKKFQSVIHKYVREKE